MATATGKKARRQNGGNRYSVKRARRRSKAEKVMTDNHLTPEAYSSMKLSHKKALADRRRNK